MVEVEEAEEVLHFDGPTDGPSVSEMMYRGEFPSTSAFTLRFAFLLCATIAGRNDAAALPPAPAAFATTEASTKESVTLGGSIEGCIECGDYRCPENPEKCLLGSVADPCGCCQAGLCGRLDGEPCWNGSIARLPPKRRNDGFCGTNYLCQLRSDLQEEDEPEATCTCMEQSPACGTNNETYATPCALHEEAMRLRNSSRLRLQHLGPCESRPWISSPLENVSSGSGQRVALNCEAKGFPVPDISWEFHSSDGRTVLKLPDKKHEATVHTSEGPEALMRTSWMQLPRLTKEQIGLYHCIANNSMGDASATSIISLA